MQYRWSYSVPLLALLICHIACGQWVESNNGIYGGTITSLASYNGNIFAGTWGGVYYSKDNAVSWRQFNAGLDNTFVNSIAVSNNGKVYLATKGGGQLFVSSEPFLDWKNINKGLSASHVIELTVINNQIFANTNDGFLFTLDDGSSSWILINTGTGPINSISSSGQNLFAATDNGIYLSTDRGLTWNGVNNGLLEKSIYAISTVNKYVIAKARIGVTFFSDDIGKTWSIPTLSGGSYKLVDFNDVLYAANESQVAYSTNQGKTWDNVTQLPGARDMIINGTTLIAGNPFGIYTSANTFQWTSNNYNRLTNSRIVGLAASQNQVFCATSRGDVLRSNNIGTTWTSISKGLPLSEATAIGYFDNILLVSLSNYGIYRSENEGGTWLPTGIAGEFTSFAKHQNQLVAGGRNGVYISTNLGRNWFRLSNSPQTVQKLMLLSRGDTLFASTPDYGISFTVNNGQSWTIFNNGIPLPQAQPITLGEFRGSIFAGAKSVDPIFIQDPITFLWKIASSGISNATLITSFESDKRNFFAAGNGGVFVSSTGLEWSPFYKEQLPLLNSPLGIESLILHRNHLLAGTDAYGVWVSCIEPTRPTISVVGNAPNDSTLVSNSPEGNQWFLNDTPIPGATQSTYKPVVSGKYTVKLRLNDCESKMSAEVNLFIKEYPEAIISMPNLFTPNGDSYNPFFIPKQYDDVSTAKIQIFDRWGNEIFESTDLMQGWDGGNSPTGVYYYHLQYTGKNGNKGTVKGWVHLIR